MHDDEHFMRLALDEAVLAGEADEVPVGAVVVMRGEVIARARNTTITDTDPSGHAEIVALRRAARAAGNHRLNGATLYVTLEPCAMCVGAIAQARVSRVVFGAYDTKAGAAGSVIDLTASPALNHRFETHGGVLSADAALMLRRFFATRRKV